jgi:hypothetical protein
MYIQNALIEEFQAAIDKEITDNMPGILIHVESPGRNISWGGAAGFSDKEKQVCSCSKGDNRDSKQGPDSQF